MRLPRTVVVLGLASLLTDLSSDMIYPLLPAYLALALGAGVVGLGAMEGAAEATASLIKVVSGSLADRARRRKPLVLSGYGLSGAAKPLIGLVASWPMVIVLRLLDRVGKGLRSAPRGALIADATPDSARGRAYGLHRSMDNAGAVLGPAAAAGLLALGFETRHVFLAAAAPAVIVLAVIALMVREAPRAEREPDAPKRVALGALGPEYRRVLAVVVLFTLGNSSDMFLLFRLSDAGLGPEGVALAWAGHNAVRTVATWFGGPLADRVDRRRLLAAGWLVYAAIYAAMAFVDSPPLIIALIVIYALHYGAVEPCERALVAEMAPPTLRGSAFGWFHGAVGIAALPASALFGLLWKLGGPMPAFGAGACLALAAALLLTVQARKRPSRALNAT
jgi:MFS family permease